jgi:hypothetical protein
MIKKQNRQSSCNLSLNPAPIVEKKYWHSKSLRKCMIATLIMIPMFAAAGWSLLYLLCGGGLGGAFLIFIVLKMFGK